MRFAVALLLLLFSSLAVSAELRGKVVRIADGDTITVLCPSNIQTKVRLVRIDAPEKKQAFGEVSRKHLASMIAGKDVRLEWQSRDKYGRILGEVYAGTTNVNLRMVADGLAWHYRNFDNTAEYAQAEKEARAKKIGLWKDKEPIAPWEFRKQQK